MTSVRVDLRYPSTADPLDVPVDGWIEWQPTARRVVGSGVDSHVTLPAPVLARIQGEPLVIDVAPSGESWCWRVTERVRGGAVRHVSVPDTVDVIAYAELADVDPGTLVPLDPVPPSAAQVLQDAADARDAAVIAAGEAANSVWSAASSASVATQAASDTAQRLAQAGIAAGQATEQRGYAEAAASRAEAAADSIPALADAAVAEAIEGFPTWQLITQAAYDALPVKDPAVLYMVTP